MCRALRGPSRLQGRSTCLCFQAAHQIGCAGHAGEQKTHEKASQGSHNVVLIVRGRSAATPWRFTFFHCLPAPRAPQYGTACDNIEWLPPYGAYKVGWVAPGALLPAPPQPLLAMVHLPEPARVHNPPESSARSPTALCSSARRTRTLWLASASVPVRSEARSGRSQWQRPPRNPSPSRSARSASPARARAR